MLKRKKKLFSVSYSETKSLKITDKKEIRKSNRTKLKSKSSNFDVNGSRIGSIYRTKTNEKGRWCLKVRSAFFSCVLKHTSSKCWLNKRSRSTITTTIDICELFRVFCPYKSLNSRFDYSFCLHLVFMCFFLYFFFFFFVIVWSFVIEWWSLLV